MTGKILTPKVIPVVFKSIVINDSSVSPLTNKTTETTNMIKKIVVKIKASSLPTVHVSGFDKEGKSNLYKPTEPTMQIPTTTAITNAINNLLTISNS